MDIDTTHAYAVAVGGIFIACALLRLRSRFKACFDFVHRLTLHYLLYPRLIRRHRFIGPWSWAAVLVQLWFVAVNAFCVGFRASSIHDVSRRAARLSLLNLVPAYSGAHLSFLADVFGISLRTFRVIHRSAGVMAFFLLAFHVAITMATRTPFPLHTAENMWGLIGASSLCLLLCLSFPLLRRPSYELFLRLHQLLAVSIVFAIWRHLRFGPLFPRLVNLVLAAIFAAMLAVQSAYLLYQNKAMGTSFSRAYIVRDGDTIKIRLRLSRHIHIKAGQYVGLWIPAVSFWAPLQTHPFVVTSWSAGRRKYLNILIEPRKGWTKSLVSLGEANEKLLGEKRTRGTAVNMEQDEFVYDSLESHFALFTGPHGLSIPVGEYETVVMIATDFGVASQLPYLEQLVYGYNACETRNRRIHLVWQLETSSLIYPIASLLNAALNNDSLDDGFILGISIHITSGTKSDLKLGERVNVYYGSTPDLGQVLKDEREGKHIRRVQTEVERHEDMAVLVSATGPIRDKVRDLVGNCFKERVTLFELDYQVG